MLLGEEEGAKTVAGEANSESKTEGEQAMPDDYDNDMDDGGGEGVEGTMASDTAGPPSAQYYRDMKDGYGMMHEIIKHHQGRVEAPHALEHMDAHTGMLNKMAAETIDAHNTNLPDEDPLAEEEDQDMKSEMGGEHEDADEPTEDVSDDEGDEDAVNVKRSRKSSTASKRDKPAAGTPLRRTYDRYDAEERELKAQLGID